MEGKNVIALRYKIFTWKHFSYKFFELPTLQCKHFYVKISKMKSLSFFLLLFFSAYSQSKHICIIFSLHISFLANPLPSFYEYFIILQVELTYIYTHSTENVYIAPKRNLIHLIFSDVGCVCMFALFFFGFETDFLFAFLGQSTQCCTISIEADKVRQV